MNDAFRVFFESCFSSVILLSESFFVLIEYLQYRWELRHYAP